MDTLSSTPPMASSQAYNGSLVSENSTESRHQQTKRNRIQLSCTHCRHAKLKCDREQPCSQCIKKGRASLCSFPTPAVRKKPTETMQNRLKHLESLVKDVMTGQPSSGHGGLSEITKSDEDRSSFAPEVGAPHQNFGREPFEERQAPPLSKNTNSISSGQVLLGLNETTYVGATHWAAILEDIEEVKSYFNEADYEDFPTDHNVRPDTTLIFNSQSPATKAELLAALPERSVVDKLIYRYFNSDSPSLHIIHKPMFQKDYRKFWNDPSSTPIIWLGLLYSLMCLATFAVYCAGEENLDSRGTPIEMIRIYRGCCAQCLVLSNYAQPGPYTLETFLTYMGGEFIIGKDDQMNCYLMAGVAVRLAMRMGLHRDSNNVTGNISPFQGELRRRVWCQLVQIDLLVSFHIGLPAMVQSIESDTAFPRNLRDEDFDENTLELPPSRPDTEMTAMSYTIHKGRLCEVFGKVAAQANLLSLPAYDEVMKLDRLLHEVVAHGPPFFQLIPLEICITDSPELIIQRFSISLLFNKSRCVLHRKYLMKENENRQFAYSKKAGLDASMELLSVQSQIHNAVQPGGPLSRNSWFLSSLSMHDFLLAAMIVYLSVIQLIGRMRNQEIPGYTPAKQDQEMVKALERSYRVWTETQSVSVDAKKAHEVTGMMVKRVYSALGNQNVINLSTTLNGEISKRGRGTAIMSGLSLNELRPSTGRRSDYVDPLVVLQKPDSDDTSPSSGLGVHTSSSSSGLGMQLDLEPVPLPIDDTLGAMIEMPSNLDWDIFDNHFRPQQLTEQMWPEFSMEDFEFGNDDDYYNL